MSYSSEAGYIPISIEQMMTVVKDNVNTQFATTYTDETFLGTNFYKYFYSLIQRLQENEIKCSEIFLRLQEYFNITNQTIQRPNTTHPGIQDYFKAAGFLISTKPPEDLDAGKVYICVDTDSSDPDYLTVVKPQLCRLVRDCVVAGVVSQGTESETITLSNGQSFDFKYNLPNEIPILLRLTTTLSENNEFTILSPDDQKQLLFDNIEAKYRLGKNFEPQRYFSVVDAPWASDVLLEYSTDNGATWDSVVYDANYDDLFTFDLGDITIVEA
jgi:hypothetical protein